MAIVVFGFAAFLYANAADNGFANDDRLLIQKNASIRQLAMIPQLFTSDYWSPRESGLYRPLTTSSLAFNYAIAELEPHGYHAVNIVLHASICVLAWFVSRTIFASVGVAAASTLLFAALAIHTEVVAGVASGRSDLLCGFFFTLALLCHIRQKTGAEYSRGLYATSLAAFFLALLSKEIGFSLLAVIALYDVCFRCPLRQSLISKVWQTARRNFRRVYLGYLGVASVALAMRFAALQGAGPMPIPFIDNPLIELGVLERFVNALAISWRYLGLLVFPCQLSYDYSFNQIPLLESLFQPLSLTVLLISSIAAGLAIRAHAISREFFFAIGFALVSFAMVSNWFVPIGTIMAERLVYIPSLGFCWLFALAAHTLAKRLTSSGLARGAAFSAVMVIMIALHGWRTLERIPDWRSAESLFLHDLEISSNSAKAQHYAGIIQGLAGRNQAAIAHYERAIEIAKPRPIDAYNNLGFLLANREIDIPRAITLLEEYLEMIPDNADTLDSLAWAYHKSGDHRRALDLMTRALKLDLKGKDALTRKKHMRAIRRAAKQEQNQQESGGVVALAEPLAAEAAPSIRLLDRVEEAEVEWPRDWQPAAPDDAHAPKSFRPLGEVRMGRISMRPGGFVQVKRWAKDQITWGDSRLAILAPTGTRYRFSLEIPSDARLRVGLGHLPREGDLPSAVRFKVGVSGPEADKESTILDRVVSVRSDNDWVDLELDLSTWSGQHVTLSLTTVLVNSEASRASELTTVWAAWSAPELIRPGHPEPGYDVILVSLDTLRADHLSGYGYERPTSPNLDAFAAEGIRFTTAISPAPWTVPAHLSMLNGFYPKSRVPGGKPRLAETLREAGYRTAAMTGGGLMDFRMKQSDFARGFDSYRLSYWLRDPEGLKVWLASTQGQKRFLFLHTYEIHGPYTHKEFAEEGTGGRAETFWSTPKAKRPQGKKLKSHEKTYLMARYDSGIAYADRQLRFLFDELRLSGALERSIVIITSDHGEQFWEHGGRGHGSSLFDHQLRVPLIFHLPPALMRTLAGEEKLTGRVIEQQVRLVDLYPTILDLLGIPQEHVTEGRSLRPLLAGSELAPVDAFAEYVQSRKREVRALRTERYKFVFSFPTERGREKGVSERRRLYDLSKDPGEQLNIAESNPELVADFELRLERLRSKSATLSDSDEMLEEFDLEGMDSDLQDRLRELGYIED
jgi:arylsulfatase A-like enzyme/tetratricopeptide (TPR) repeat protein